MILRFVYGAVICIALFTFYQKWAMHRAMENMRVPLWQNTLTDASMIEDEDAVVPIIVEFMDYRCGYCRTVHPVLMQLMEDRPKVKIVVRPYPIFGAPSIREARMALAAGKQDKFIEMHKTLITRDLPVQEADIDLIAQDLGLDVAQFRIDMNSEEVTAYLLGTLDGVEALSINATPSFLIGRLVYSGTPDLKGLKDMLVEAYGAAGQ